MAAPSIAFAAGKQLTAPGAAGQAALSVEVRETAVSLGVCSSLPCTAKNPQSLELPPTARAWVPGATLQLVKLAKGHHAVHVRLEDPAGNQAWEAVIAGPKSGAAPVVVFSGFTGATSGLDGERRGAAVWVTEPTAQGQKVFVGQQREDVSLCGRPAMLAPQVLLTEDLRLHPTKLQRLTAAEQSRAPVITAERAEGSGAPLRATVATSALGAPQAISDGNAQTSWSEARSGVGRGEFVRMTADPELALRAFQFLVRPSAALPSAGAAPRAFWIATDAELFRVELDHDVWAEENTWYQVKLPNAVHTTCVAVVVESAFQDAPDTAVTIAEFTAALDFDVKNAAVLVADLDKPDAAGQTALTQLRAGGALAHPFIAQGFGALGARGRALALELLTSAQCAVAFPAYSVALTGDDSELREVASARVVACGEAVAEPLRAEFRRGNTAQRVALAPVLAKAAPSTAVSVLVDALETPPKRAETNRTAAYQAALHQAALHSSARPAIISTLEDGALSPSALMQTLQGLGSLLVQFMPQSAAAFDRLAQGGEHDFAFQYRLLGVAAHLAKVHPPAAQVFGAAFSDANPHLRARAASLALASAEHGRVLAGLLQDPEVRVRQAAVQRIGDLALSGAASTLLPLLKEDPWPFLRANVATTLGQLPLTAATDEALRDALEDTSSTVRRAVVHALAARGVTGATDDILDHLDDSKEDVHVRSAAAGALATLCAYTAVDTLTEYAAPAARLDALKDEQTLGRAAIIALGRLAPPDLQQRLEPFLTRDAAPGTRIIAQSALARSASHCKNKP